MPGASIAEKKLREARFFLAHLTAATGTELLADERFDFYLSAFLSAARSVTFALQAEHKSIYDAWFPQWQGTLSQDDRALFNLIKNERNAALKRGETSSQLEIEAKTALHFYIERPLATGLEPWMFDENATIGVTNYYLEIEGSRQPAVVVFARGLGVLERLLAEFTSLPSPT